MKLKSKVSFFLVFYFSLIIISNVSNDDNSAFISNLFQEELGLVDDDVDLPDPMSSNLDAFNKSHYFLIIDEPFGNSLDDWTVSGDGIGEAWNNASNYKLRMTGDSPIGTEDVYVEYNVAFPEFIRGNVSFEYVVLGVFPRTLRFQVNNTGGWEDVWTRSTIGAGIVNLDIGNHDSDDSNFNVRFWFTGRTSDDRAVIDNFKMGSHEFFVEEKNGDALPSDQDQQISAYICPDFNDYTDWQENNVSLKFNVNSKDMGSGTLLTASETSNNFTFNIGEGNYSVSDMLYYQVSISSSASEYHQSDIFSFSFIDITAPTLNLQGNNVSTYYNDVLIRCHVEDESGGSGLKNVTMYIKNATGVGKSDTLILSNRSASIPSGGGDFGFLVSSRYLSARAGEQLRYIIYVIDLDDNEDDSGEHSLTINDDVEPNIMLKKIHAPLTGIENNQSLLVSYEITEPRSGVGMTPLGFGVSLYLKKNGAPDNASDYDLSLTPSFFPFIGNGGIYNFTIPESVYSWNETLYFFVNASDWLSNTNTSFSKVKSVYVNDTYAPNVDNNLNNGLDVMYNQSKTLSFTISEPPGAAGIDNDTLTLSFEIDHWTDIGRQTIEKNLPLTGGPIDFIIDEANYSYGQTVYYQLNVSDRARNNYSSVVGSFYVGDGFAPLTSFISYLNPSPQYSEDVNITLSAWEDPDGSLFSTLELFVKNDTSNWGDAIRIFDTNRTSVSGLSGTIYIEFKINSSITYARYALDWALFAKDNENNERNVTGQITIHDNINPSIIYDSNNGTADTFEYDEFAAIYYNILEPKDGSGFNTGGTGLKLYYNNGSSSDPTDNDGSEDVFNATVLEYGGRYMFIIPESFLVHGMNISFWLNGTDIQENLNGTWDDRRSITVVDTTAPLISLDSDYNDDPVSYHLDKKIIFTPTEYTDSSRLKNATLYWSEGGNPTTSNHNGSFDYSNFTIGGIGGSIYYWTLVHSIINFNYSNEIRFIIQVHDMAGNSIVSVIYSFNITDTIYPNSNEHADNTNAWTWRVNRKLWFDVYDPDYDTSSGIASIRIFWKAGSAPTIADHDGVRINSTPALERKWCEFEVELNETLYLNGPTIYYFIQVTDVKGNKFNSTVQSFIIHNDVFKPYSVIGPAIDTWLASGEISIFMDMYFETNLWITINGTVYYSDSALTQYNDKVIINTDGYWIIEFKFLDNNSIKTFKVHLDLTPPGQVSNVIATLYGLDVVQLTWNEPTGVDSNTTYHIYRSTSATFTLDASTLITTRTLSQMRLYSDSNIVTGTMYYYIIIAVDKVGHKSIASTTVTILVPPNVLMPMIILVIIGAVVSIAIVGLKKKSTAKKRELLFTKVDLKDLKLGDEELLVTEDSQPKWTKIETKAKEKPIIEDGFEFSGPTSSPRRTGRTAYWQESMAKMISKVAQYELEGNYGKARTALLILIRLSKRTRNALLTLSLEAIFNDLNERAAN